MRSQRFSFHRLNRFGVSGHVDGTAGVVLSVCYLWPWRGTRLTCAATPAIHRAESATPSASAAQRATSWCSLAVTMTPVAIARCTSWTLVRASKAAFYGLPALTLSSFRGTTSRHFPHPLRRHDALVQSRPRRERARQAFSTLCSDGGGPLDVRVWRLGRHQ